MDVYAWVANQAVSMRADLIELANQNSGSDHLVGLLQVADWLEDWMDLPAASFSRIALPPRRMISDSGDELAVQTAPLLRWDFQPERPRRVLLAIHYDTVFGPDSGFLDCELLDSNRLSGPGVADAKGGIVVIRNALKALMEYRLVDEIGWSIVLNPDEEVGSTSSVAYLQQIAPEFDFGLLFEPALPNGELVSERKGSGNFDLVFRGQSAHAGRNFDKGKNAVAALCRLLVELDSFNGQRPGTTLNIGRIIGGGAVNVVPDLAVARFNVRVQDEASWRWLEGGLQAAIESANQQLGYHCQLVGQMTSPPKVVTPAMRHLMESIESAIVACSGKPVDWKATGGVCDGNKLAAAGLPNIDTLGPIGDGLHSKLEWVQLDSLVEKSQVIVNLLSRFSAGEFPELCRYDETFSGD